MNFEVIVTCAVTGAGDTVGKHPGVPVTPEQIAQAAIDAAKAGATAAHLHVRDPLTGNTCAAPMRSAGSPKRRCNHDAQAERSSGRPAAAG